MRFRFKDHPAGYVVGSIDIPSAAPGRVSVVAVGEGKADALAKAALIAEHIAKDPVMSALLPPQALPAIMAAKALAAAAHNGPAAIKHLWGRIRGEGKKRLASVLHAEAVKLDEDERKELGWNPFRRKRRRGSVRRRRHEDDHEDDQDDDDGAERPPVQPAPPQASGDDVSDVDGDGEGVQS